MPDLVAIVDEHDNTIGTKSREELSETDIIRVSILWIEDGKGNVLLQQRSLNKKLGPGLWGPAVAGTVEAHETPLSNIIKEAREEIGLIDFRPVEVGKQLLMKPGEPFGRMITFYKAKINKPAEEFTIKEDEIDQIQWVPKAELFRELEHDAFGYVPSAIFWKQMFG